MYWSPAHTRADAMLKYSIETCAPITVITGEIGSGKTTLLREMLRTMEDKITVGLVSNTQGGQEELMQWVLMSLDLPIERGDGYVQMFQQFQSFLISEYAAGRHTVLIFDEAQNFRVETLEELRMLTNINADTDPLLQVILVGQPELADKIKDPRLVQFAQRVAAEAHLKRLESHEIEGYIAHRLKVAGSKVQIFADDAFDLIYHASRGTPRLINQICEYAMVYAYSMEKQEIDAGIIEQVLADRTVFSAQPEQKPAEQPAPVLTRNTAKSRVKLVETLKKDDASIFDIDDSDPPFVHQPSGSRSQTNAELYPSDFAEQHPTDDVPSAQEQAPDVRRPVSRPDPLADALHAGTNEPQSASLDLLHRAERALRPRRTISGELTASTRLTTEQPEGSTKKLSDVHKDGKTPNFPGVVRK